MHRHWVRLHRRVRILAAGALLSPFLMGGCLGLELDSEIVQRFRAAYAPGLAAGLQTAVLQPGDAEEGLRRAWAALMEGLAAVVALRVTDS